MTSRSLIQRSCVLLGIVALSVYLFYIGKGHTLLIDTNAVTINGKEFKSAETIEVRIDGKEPESMGRAERIMVSVGGPRHTIAIEVISGGDQKVGKRFSVPTFMDTAIISVPAILGDTPEENWITKFTAPPPEDTPAEQMQTQEDAPIPPAAAVPVPLHGASAVPNP